jgi:hypothetical protein
MPAGTIQRVLTFFWVITAPAALGLHVTPSFNDRIACDNPHALECSWDAADVSELKKALLAGHHNMNGVLLVILEMHQACFFDNFVSSLGAIKDWTLPVIAVTVGPGADKICQETMSASQQLNFSTELRCTHNGMWKPTTGASEVGHYRSHDFFQLGWMRVQIAEFATRQGVRVIVSDLDNIFIADPLGALQPFLDKPQIIATRDGGLNNLGGKAASNLGVWVANPQSHAATEKWLRSWAGDDSVQDSDQDRYNQLFPVDMSVPTVLPESFANIFAYKFKKASNVVSVHCFGVKNKTACLKNNNLWHSIRNLGCDQYVG